MQKLIVFFVLFAFMSGFNASILSAGPMKGPWEKPDTRAQHIFDTMVESFKGEWRLAPIERQIDTTGAHLGVKEFLGKDLPMTTYTVISRGVVLLEMMLTGTDREMVTTYHCNRRMTCEVLLATHYCAKRNVVRYVINLDETTDTRFVFDCDMGSSLCQSKEDHIFRIVHEFTDDGNRLKSSYLGRTNHILNERLSIFHYEKR